MKLRFKKSKDKKESKANRKSTFPTKQVSKPKETKGEASFQLEITTNLQENIKNMNTMLGEPSDLTVRELTGKNPNQKCAMLYIGGLIDQTLVHNNILKSILKMVIPHGNEGSVQLALQNRKVLK